MDLTSLNQFLQDHQEPGFRFKQLRKNYYSGRYSSFTEMTDISLGLRQLLSQNFSLYSVQLENIIKEDHIQKALLKLSDGQKIETVLMDHEDWLTACVSSQVGCPLGCKFCATGQMGLIRQLTSKEIVDQILFWNHQLYPKYVGRIVFMGMGEPFLNWENLLASIEIINSPDGLNMGARKISISTAGIAPRIIDFANLNTQINLAISLHSADQVTRESIMPVASQYSLSYLKKATDYYVQKTNRQVFFEYALINQVNDTPYHAQVLADFIKSNRLYYLNIIPLNPVKNGLPPSTPLNFNKFTQYLDNQGVEYSIRHSLGQSTHSACGQLIVK